VEKQKVQSGPTALQRSIGEKVMVLRKRKRWTQEKLAGMTGNSANTIRRVERGDGSDIAAVRLFAIAQALDVPMGYFFGEVTL
jgi:transcriptional regulator with XRE-family HTH domain